MNADCDDLGRFVGAQNSIYSRVTAELAAGAKQSHWMWFIFPQVEGLGSSAMAQRYAIRSRAEAEAYLDHPVLGPRLRECTRLVLAVHGKSLREILGSPDDAKFKSSMTLFDSVAPNAEFAAALDRYCSGERDPATSVFLQRGIQ
ncbi:hypothetical protein SSBR45G_00440 [Bradyrhizobium sp. SSBR45G]|uniref:DUF1810 domain-containing protein n=1 Tax=unclassified Bradyrhizobium TaxID=2631580 RepID=UPI0023429885|nr:MULTISPECIES: DUF1810 domain-containing protein [unclassified Bradyrhizobium]GLH75136.1 hypothetical protein SSBR45G_00440 [Bradyrhizobium sp. SSBR45G]GLH83077.1 hypothetical protein SSBR45R_05370 [Bradyrhizobium sp. SSBR45R]